MLNLDHVRERLRPGFRPFALVTSDGRSFKVPHPDFVAVGRSVVVILGDNDSSTKIDALHIVSIEDLPSRKHR